MSRAEAPRRDIYRCFVTIPTRWTDNDVYGHVNNIVYYAFFDTAINRRLIEKGVLDLAGSATVGLVVESKCTYFSSLAFPNDVQVGLRVLHLGTSSVRYEVGIFRRDAQVASAVGEFVHVYVKRGDNRATPIPDDVRVTLLELMVPA
ncbi:thioesterase family protein [Bordetella sp. BOR01]|uniref:acyl-CoA thioesterase n=1 Tax=Bordetella sp. BOR01 TaxID=2854779 RepID=UPI001C475782|nr:thioesterase family protein [Bordetella sp. BOR01]MBV7481691.1 acyl-CoA thioesterase [Bordetella sp. BOR01]